MFDKLVDLIVNFANLFRFWEVVDQYQRGIVLRLGKFHREVGPGIHWLIPFNVDRVIETAVVTRTSDLRQAFLTINDGTTVAVSVVVRWNVKDVKKLLLDVWDYNDVIRDSVFGNVSRKVRAASWDELNSPSFAEELYKDCRKQAFRYGVEIEDVVLSDLCRTRATSLLGQPVVVNGGGA